MHTGSVKITSKGQVTLPKIIRDFISSDVITFDIIDDQVIIKPVRNVAGSLKKYNKTIESFQKIRAKAWQDSIGKKSDQ
ncbi:transcriptional regulator, AbrB family (plasmid) [Rickettsiales bacterium Ac37b]|nr:transcriptional regulator, AbrB family [Rickettsiales bacterium Ac37b]